MHLPQADALVVFSWLDYLINKHPTSSLLFGWAVGILSYHQDSKYHAIGLAILSQILAITCLIALIVFGFTHHSWPNFLIAPVLIWLHYQFSKRWWAKPGVWW